MHKVIELWKESFPVFQEASVKQCVSGAPCWRNGAIAVGAREKRENTFEFFNYFLLL